MRKYSREIILSAARSIKAVHIREIDHGSYTISYAPPRPARQYQVIANSEDGRQYYAGNVDGSCSCWASDPNDEEITLLSEEEAKVIVARVNGTAADKWLYNARKVLL